MDPGYAMLALDDATHGIHLSLGSMVRDPLSIQAVRDAHNTIRSHGVHLQYRDAQALYARAPVPQGEPLVSSSCVVILRMMVGPSWASG